jgi:inner membrane protein
MALLFSAPAWAVWKGRVPIAFAALSLVTAMAPDLDLVLRQFLPVEHHGVTHTVLYAVVVSVVVGLLATLVLRSPLDRFWKRPKDKRPSQGMLFWFVGGAFLAGGLAHIMADLLSAPDIADPLAPFWPVYNQHIVIDVVWYSSPWANFGLLAAGILAHVALATFAGRKNSPFVIR